MSSYSVLFINKNFCKLFFKAKTSHNQIKQEVSDDLSICVLKLLHEVGNPSSLVAISIVKVEI